MQQGGRHDPTLQLFMLGSSSEPESPSLGLTLFQLGPCSTSTQNETALIKEMTINTKICPFRAQCTIGGQL